MGSTGFSSERTSEYMILHDLYTRIKPKCQLFYPFFYHKGRSDTKLSLMNDPGELQIVACFARRPKTDSIFSNMTVVSFRSSIFDQVDFFEKFHIPVISGTPIGNGIESVGFGGKCQWFEIKPGNYNYIEYRFKNEVIDTGCLIEGIRLLDDKQIYEVLLSAPKLSWLKTMELVQKWYEAYFEHYFTYHHRNLYYSISGLKPVFIAYQI